MLVIAFTFWSLAIKTHIFVKGFNLNVFAAILLMFAIEIIRHIPIAILIWPLVQQQGGA
jgi:hypothetical protein